MELAVAGIGAVWYTGTAVIFTMGLKQSCSSCQENKGLSSCSSCELGEERFHASMEAAQVSVLEVASLHVHMYQGWPSGLRPETTFAKVRYSMGHYYYSLLLLIN